MNTADQERIGQLLTDTVLMLCKSSVRCHNTLKLQGLLGITVDDGVVFLVHIDNQSSVSNVTAIVETDEVNTNLLADGVSMLCKSCVPFNSNLTIQGLIGLTIDVSKVVLVSIQDAFSNTTQQNHRAPVDEYQLLQEKLVNNLIEANKCHAATVEHIRELSNSMQGLSSRGVLQAHNAVGVLHHNGVNNHFLSEQATSTSSSKSSRKGTKSEPDCIILDSSEGEDNAAGEGRSQFQTLLLDPTVNCNEATEFSVQDEHHNLLLKCEEDCLESSTTVSGSANGQPTNDLVQAGNLNVYKNYTVEQAAGLPRDHCTEVKNEQLVIPVANMVFDTSSQQLAPSTTQFIAWLQPTNDNPGSAIADDNAETGATESSILLQREFAEKKTRRSFTADFKLKVVRAAMKVGNREAGRLYNLGESVVRVWRRMQVDLASMPPHKRARRSHASNWPQLEHQLQAWIVNERRNGKVVNTPAIRRHAVSMAKAMGIEGFTGCSSWCFRFMKRKSLSAKQ